jgi:3-isopropylmalate/(R)-2-methylmalate dehydratase small subunit
VKAFERFSSVAMPLDDANVDTDRIIPARFLRKPREVGYGQFLFHDVRQQPEFILNNPAFQDAQILITGENFGCGSSREGAVWALIEGETGPLKRGVRALIGPSFGDIFYNNALRNGLLAICLPAEVVAIMRARVHENPGATIEIDLATQRVIGPGAMENRFEVDPFRKDCLVRGLDDIGMTMECDSAFEEFEARRKALAPWLYDQVSDSGH